MRPTSKARRRANRRAAWAMRQAAYEGAYRVTRWGRTEDGRPGPKSLPVTVLPAEQTRYEDLPDLLDPIAIKKYHIGLDPEAAARLIKEHLIPVVQADGKTWIPKAALWRYYNLPLPN